MSRPKSVLGLILFLVLPGSLTAHGLSAIAPSCVVQDTKDESESSPPSEQLLQDCLLYDGLGGPPMEGASVLIRDGKIERIYEAGDVPAPAPSIIDCEGKLVIPGLVDLQSHFRSAPMFLGGYIPVESGLNEMASVVAGTVLALSTGDDRFGTQEGVAGPDIIGAGPVLMAKGSRLPWSGGKVIEVDGRDSIESALDELQEFDVEWAQIIWDNLGWLDQGIYPTFDEETLLVLIESAQRRGMQVAVWSMWGQNLLKASEFGAHLIVGAPLAEGSFPNRFSEALLLNGTAYVPMTSFLEAGFRYYDQRSVFGDDVYLDRSVPKIVRDVLGRALRDLMDRAGGRAARLAREGFPNLATAVAEFIEIGLPLAAGSGGGQPLLFHGFGLLRELEIWVTAGASVEKAVRAASLGGAIVLGAQKERGSIEVGKRADLVVIDGDPRSDPEVFRKVTGVMLDGLFLDRDFLYRQLQPPEARVVGVQPPNVFFEGAFGTLEAQPQASSLYDSKVIGKSIEAEVVFEQDADRQWARWEGIVDRAGIHAGFAGMKMEFTEPEGPWDAREFDGISIRCRGSETTFKAIIQTSQVRDGNAYLATFVPRSDWGEVRIPFASFRQPGTGLPVEWSGSDLTGFRLHTQSLEMMPFRLEVESVGFYAD